MLFLVGVAAIYGLMVAALAVGQRKLMYFPNVEDVAPDDAGLPRARVISLRTDDGETLVAWSIPPAPGRPTLLYFHGNGGGLELRSERFRQLTRTGAGLIAVEYRGYGRSTGSPSEDGLCRDGEAGYAEALALGVSPSRLVVIGESLGSGVAVAVAARHRIGALALDSPFSSAVDVAAAHYWMFPVRLLMRDRFRSDQKIEAVGAPLLIVHGTNDAVVPIRFGERLFARAREPKQFMRIEGGGHLAMGETIPEVLAWIDRVLAA